MKALLSALILVCSLHSQAQTSSLDTIKRINKAANIILEDLLSDKMDLVLLKDEKGEYLTDKDNQRLTEFKIDEDYTDLENDHLKFGGRLTLNTSRWSPGEQSGLAFWVYGNIKRAERSATIGMNSNLETKTMAFVRFFIKNAVKETWKNGLHEDADFFETVAYNNLKAAGEKLQSLEELFGILVFLKGGVLTALEEAQQELPTGSLSPSDIKSLSSLRAVEISFEKNELLISYNEELDEHKFANSALKGLSVSKLEVRLTESSTKFTLQVTFTGFTDDQFDDWESQKEQGLSMIEMFLPIIEGSPEQAQDFTRDLKKYIEKTIDFLTNEDAEFNFL